MHIFVTGSSGFVGKNVVERLKELKHKVTTFDFTENSKHDVTRLEPILSYMPENIDAVIHLASKTKASESLKCPLPYINIIVMGTANILEAMRLKKIKRLVYISSCGIKGMNSAGGNPYHYSKYLAEQLCEMYSKIYDIEIVVLRPTVMYGPRNWKGVVRTFINLTKKGKTLKIYGDGSQTRDFLHVYDAREAMIKAAMVNLPNKFICIEIGTGKVTSIKELAEAISDDVEYIPSKNIGISSSVANICNARYYLGWEPKINIKNVIKNQLV